MMTVIHSRKLQILITIILVLMPSVARAAVTISEVAWMGTETSANDEWLELYNDGEATSLDGWQLTDGDGLAIALSGTMAANAYAVLERTDDTSAPGDAFLVYTGALANTGATLQLYDETGALVDQVAGGENWESIGGDNTTKETAQLTNNGWVTAAATPGAAPVDTSASQPEETKEEESDEKPQEYTFATADSSESETTSIYLTPRELSVAITMPKRTYVNQAVAFVAEGDGVGEAIVRSLHYRWNFGDGTTGTSSNPTHRYAYPGNYVVTLTARYGDYEADHRRTITVLPTTLSATVTKAGDLQLHNDAKYEVDVSGFRVGGVPGVVLPEGTIMLPGSTITLPKSRFSRAPLAVVYDKTARLVYGREKVPKGSAPAKPSPVQPTVSTRQNTPSTFSFPSQPTATPSSTKATEKTTPTARSIPTAHAAGSSTSPQSGEVVWPWYAVIGLLMLATVGVYTRYL